MPSVDRSSPEFGTFHGTAALSPLEPVEAGSTGTWRVVYRVGRYGVDDGGMIRVARRFVSDAGVPQTGDPGAPNYMSVATSGNARVRARFDPQSHVRPWQKAVTIYVDSGCLAEGDLVTLVLGDTAQGGPGMVMQTFCEPRYELKVLVDCFGTGSFVELDSAGTFEIVSGPASGLKFIAPTDVGVGERFRASLKAQDKWGNPAAAYEGTVRIAADSGLESVPAAVVFTPEHGGVVHIDGLRALTEGVVRLAAADDAANLRASSNAIIVHARPPVLRRYWGDLHGQSEETIGSKSVDEYFAFARDKALVDFAGHQGNCFQITSEIWRRIREAVKACHEPGRFIAFLGYEWSGLTPGGGDRNVYFLGDDGPLHRCSHWLVEDDSDADSDCYPVTELYEKLRGRSDVMIVPHVGGRYADLAFHDPELEPLIEICSSWGEFEWLLEEALERGYRVGVSCGSDDHKGRPGASHPGSATFGVRGGLLCVCAEDLTREALWSAIQSRRCYGTTGERIALEVQANGVPMGGALKASAPPAFQIRVRGTAGIERIELRRVMRCVACFPDAGSVRRSGQEVRIAWSGARFRGRERIAHWDGHVEAVGTTIAGVRGYAFDSAAEGITESTSGRVAWKSVTTGDTDGVILTLEPADEGTLRFETDIVRFELALNNLGSRPVVHEAGGLGLRVAVERLPTGIGKDVSIELADDSLAASATPYHVMVLQTDGAKAWSSPIWVEPA